MVVALLVATAASAWICFLLARRKCLQVPFWVALAALIGPLAIPLVLLAKRKDPQS